MIARDRGALVNHEIGSVAKIVGKNETLVTSTIIDKPNGPC